MDIERDFLGHIRVVLEVDPSLQHFTDPKQDKRQSFASHLLQYLNDLVASLAIPARISLSVRSGSDEQRSVVEGHQVFINDKKCRLPLSTPRPQALQERQLANAVAKGIYQNRELLIDIGLSEKIREEWPFEDRPAPPGGLSPEDFHRFLSTLVRRGFRINRAADAWTSEKQERSDRSVEGDFESAVSRLDSTTIKVVRRSGSTQTLSATEERPLEEQFSLMQDRIFDDLGILVPKVVIETDESLPENDFRIQLNDVTLPNFAGLKHNQFLVNETPERLAVLKIIAEAAINPESGSQCAIIENNEQALQRCRDKGLTVWGPEDFVVLTLTGEIRRNAGNFLSVETVEYRAQLLQEAWPTLVHTVLKRFDTVQLTAILRSLLDEEISIRNLTRVLESLLAINGTTNVDHSQRLVFQAYPTQLCPVTGEKTIEDLETVDYTNCVRMSLKRYISHKYTRGGNTLLYYTIDPATELRILDIDNQPLTEVESMRMVKAILAKIKDRRLASNPVILTSVLVRKRLRALIEKEFPQLAVLCYQELSPDVITQRIAQISWS